MTRSENPSPLWLVVAALALAGLAVTTYLTSSAIANTGVACSTGGCNTVLASKWSKVFGVPVSVFGMASYATIMLGSLHAYQTPVDDLRGRLMVSGVAAIGVLASIYLTSIEFFVIKAVCQYCVASALLMLITAGVVVVIARREGPLWTRITRSCDSSGDQKGHQ